MALQVTPRVRKRASVSQVPLGDGKMGGSVDGYMDGWMSRCSYLALRRARSSTQVLWRAAQHVFDGGEDGSSACLWVVDGGGR